jgi:hypothetical protein
MGVEKMALKEKAGERKPLRYGSVAAFPAPDQEAG